MLGCCDSLSWFWTYLWPAQKASESISAQLKDQESDFNNLELMIPVLLMQERFSGFERKIQIKALKWKGDKALY